MVTVNKKLEAITAEDVIKISEEYLRGWHNLLPRYGFTIKGLNNKRKQLLDLDPLTKSISINYRVEYVKRHFSENDVYNILSDYLEHARVDNARWDGIELFDCLFNGKDYAECFRRLIGVSEYEVLSEISRRKKLIETQTNLYGGVGLAGEDTKFKAQETNIMRYGASNVMNGKLLREMAKFQMDATSRNMINFTVLPEYQYIYEALKAEYDRYLQSGERGKWLSVQSRFELVAFAELISVFGYDDVIPQYNDDLRDQRYPYVCDFYVKSQDLFIELNIHSNHGNRWFDVTNQLDRLKLHDLKLNQPGSKQITMWAGSDVIKRKTAQDHNLNYLVFWDGRSSKRGDFIVPRLADFRIWLHDFKGDTFLFINSYPENSCI